MRSVHAYPFASSLPGGTNVVPRGGILPPMVTVLPIWPWKKSSGTFSRRENLRFSRELRSRDRIHATEQAVCPQPAIAGLVASSSAQRLKPRAIDIRVNIDPVHWF